jgi:3-hydroxy-9,10-secoandrosta-1,3,5(10)-triene-9,17-dione monooxygenase
MFGQEAQDTVWADNDDVLIGSAFAPLDGKGERVEGGYVLRGTWQFSSGSAACTWMILGVPLHGGGPQQRIWCLLQRPQWEPVDTWYAAGLRGSGSGDVHVEEAFVPDAFSLDISQLDGRPSPGSAVNPGYIYRIPLWPTFPYNVTAPALGVARGAIEAFSEQHTGRPDRAAMPQRQLKVAHSAAEVDAAEALLLADAEALKRISSAGEKPDATFVAKLKRDLSFAVMLCSQAVERLATSVGAHGIAEANPVNRASRDMHAIANHAANSWDTAGLAFGQVSFGVG